MNENKPRNKLAELMFQNLKRSPPEHMQLPLEGETDPVARRTVRQFNRLIKYAYNQSFDELAAEFAWAVISRATAKRSERIADGHANNGWRWASTYRRLVNEQKQARRAGGIAKLTKDPTAVASQLAKKAANDLWPESQRKGWTAVRFHAELTAKGFEIAPDTVRKWVTKLRRTGMC